MTKQQQAPKQKPQDEQYHRVVIVAEGRGLMHLVAAILELVGHLVYSAGRMLRPSTFKSSWRRGAEQNYQMHYTHDDEPMHTPTKGMRDAANHALRKAKNGRGQTE